MKLFEVLPDRFFSLFSGGNKDIYAEAVLSLYEQYKISRFGIDYELMRDLFQELIETYEELGVEFEPEEERLGYSDETEGIHRGKANALLRKLLQMKWIDVETRNNFKQYIILPHYSIRILGVLQDLCKARKVELQSYALNTYYLLSSESMEEQPSLAIFEAANITDRLIEELRLLLNNMKSHMEQVVSKQSLQEVLDHHFDNYMKKIVDKSYHRLRTSDHVSKYRLKILETVHQWTVDEGLFSLALDDAMKSGLCASLEEAEERLKTALQFIQETYGNLDELYEQIDIRHHQYLKSSYDRARYLTQHNQGMEYKIASILEALTIEDGSLGHFVTEVFRINETNILVEKSLLAPRKKREAHQPERHKVIPISEELKKKIRNKSIEKIENAINRQKINQFVLERLRGRNEVGMSELAPKTIEEYLYLPYVYLYGYDLQSDYRLVRANERCILHIGEFRFDDRTIMLNNTKKREAKR
ncbi:Wadjet anti-phage system protein JetA family protein [Bacillus sp. FJAT-27245]|uniref:Wadjet anti-phage system protein JetA family protein n=1 Tax=Bacillus sp. FJAT-27245 TaxID=1684144 RepID=UPI0006A7C38F|nr:Wadjet anti-phage system protein JetA family protein [Bacillus sp. FJAT-27245]